ncbi:tol-pal system YbgF family protein [Streptacidiphilus sp. EB103A]|uniref:tetratricopeptide repeat protein n=1 Tax=Streptacidiphilus sp. EB103A TaxID=3156275 RepID=UPI003519B455
MRTTNFRVLVQQKNWTTLAAFSGQWKRACQEAAQIHQDARLKDIPLSERNFSRWMLGETKSLPRPDTRRVLEHLFAMPVEELFKEHAGVVPHVRQPSGPVRAQVDAPEADELLTVQAAVPMDSLRPGSAAVDPLLVPHWGDLLQILSDAHNSAGPRRIHESAIRELAVIRGFRRQAAGAIRVGLLGVEARWSEFASWTSDNLGRTRDASFWLSRASELAQEAGDRTMTTYIQMRQAQRAADHLDVAGARALSVVSSDFLQLSARDQALCEVRRSQGAALAGDMPGFSAAIASAVRLVERADTTGVNEDPGTIGLHCNLSYVQAHEGFGLMRLGQAGDAVRHLEGVLATWPADYRQDEQLARAWLGLAYAAEGRFDEAAAQGMRVVTMPPTESVRALRALSQLVSFVPQESGGAEIERFRLTCAVLAPRM